MRAKDNPCPVTDAQCYAPDCTDSKCDFQDPSEAREEGYAAGLREFLKEEVSVPESIPDPALETRIENTEKAITDLYWQLKQLKEKWEGK